jgi:pimeloyl-ACP methyl ester carboxylesterase/predicted glycosyltransferase
VTEVDRYGDASAPGNRALRPLRTGVAHRDGVDLAWSVYGTGDVTVLMMPTWSIVPSRVWKAQVPYLSRHYRVVTFDGRGSGASSRPAGGAAYANGEYVADALAVLDDVGAPSAIVVSLSAGGTWSVQLAAEHPDRVLGLFAIGPALEFDREVLGKRAGAFAAPSEQGSVERSSPAWRYNRDYWLGDGYDDFVRWFFDLMYPEPHSTKQIEDAVTWAHDIGPQTLADTSAGRLGLDGASTTDLEDLCARVRCPVVVLHGTEDHIRPIADAERLARLTGGTLIRAEGSGHGPMARDPVMVNHEIRRFVDSVGGLRTDRHQVRAARRGKRVLYLSSPIGLGHARRDLAVADQLRTLHPEIEVQWLAQDPVTRVLAAAGEHLHPASYALASEAGHVEVESGEHDLNAFRAIRRMDEILVANFHVFDELTEDEHFDLIIGDEAWDVDYFLHENPQLKRSPYAWFTDFVGWLPTADGGEEEALLAADHNAEMIEQRARFPRLRDRSIFVGTAEDIVPDAFGPGLPPIREWTEANFDFAGYVTGFDPTVYADREGIRARLGFRPDERVCLVTVGGTGVGKSLLRRVLDAVPLARRMVPELRFLVVAGPRIDPRRLPRRRGATVVGFLPELAAHLAACDVAVVQGGLTTCMELTALRRPFLYVPLEHHFEQNFHVRRRLERYRAGTHVPYGVVTDPEGFAEAVVKELGRDVDYREVETDGAACAARLLAQLL